MTINSNTITRDSASGTMIGGLWGTSTDLAVTNNNLSYLYDDESDDGGAVLSVNGHSPGMTITSNTITVSSSLTSNVQVFQFIAGGEGVNISGNKIKYSAGANSPLQLTFREYGTSSLVFSHNTVYYTNINGNDGIPAFARINDDDVNFIHPLSATATYNVFYFDGTGTTTEAQGLLPTQNVTTSVFYEDYNGYAGQLTSGEEFNPEQNVSSTVTRGGNSQVIADGPNVPAPLKLGDVPTDNDFELVPFSSFLDVNGALDMGAVSAVRGSSFTIDDDCTIDYSTCHAVSTLAMSGNVQSGDTWSILAGTYSPFALSTTTLATSNITISGAGADTIIEGEEGTNYGIDIDGFDDFTVENLVIQNVSSTVVPEYLVDPYNFAFAGNDYDDIFDPDEDPMMMLFVTSTACELPTIYEEETDVGENHNFELNEVGETSFVESDWNLALVHSDLVGPERVYLTVFTPNDYHSTTSTMESVCAPFGIIVDAWVTSTFVYDAGSGEYTYDSAKIAAAGVTVIEGSPGITRSVPTVAGLIYSNSSNGSIINVTSTDNSVAVSFEGSSSVNLMSSSTLQNSVDYDVVASTVSYNTFDNVAFTRASSSIQSGSVLVTYRQRVYVEDTGGSPIEGVEVDLEAASLGDSDSLVTDATGYTSYSNMLVAFVMNTSSIAVTNGGYNPYTFTANATSTFGTTSTDSNLTMPNETFTVVMVEGAPSAPSSMVSTTVATSSIGVSWTDNSSNETSFLFDFIASDDSDDFPGTTSSLAANAVAATTTDLAPNTAHMFRVAAIGSGGASGYAVSPVVYTDPTVPGTPAATADGSDEIDLIWDNNDNASTTVYQIYNVTDDALAGTTTGVSYSGTGLDAATSYQFRVRAEYAGASGSYSAYSGTSTAVATDAEAEEEEGNTGGGSSKSGGTPPTLDVDEDEALEINGGAASTNNREVTLSIAESNATQMAVSEDPDLGDVSFVDFDTEATFMLSEGNGVKTVYVKLKKGGSSITIEDSIELVGQDFDAPTPTEDDDDAVECGLPTKSAYKHPDSSSVYYITAQCTKRAFISAERYATYFPVGNPTPPNALLPTVPTPDWSLVGVSTEVNAIAEDTLGFMPWGPYYNPQFGALVKQPDDPKVYLLLNGEKNWITDPEVFEALNYQWSWIEDVHEDLLPHYATGSEIDYTDHHPDFSVVKYAAEPAVYRLETPDGVQVKRWIPTPQAFNALNYRWDRIITIPDTETYPDGESL